MIKKIIILASICVFSSSIADAQEDPREFVAFPPELQLKMMSNMRDHMAALSEILADMAYDDLNKAADVAEHRLGLSARHSHNTAGLAKYMPQGMRQAGFNMHSAASSFAQIAKKGDAEAAYEALSEVTSACVECHAGYRIR